MHDEGRAGRRQPLSHSLRSPPPALKNSFHFNTNFEINLHLINILHVLWSVMSSGPPLQTLQGKDEQPLHVLAVARVGRPPGAQGPGACARRGVERGSGWAAPGTGGGGAVHGLRCPTWRLGNCRGRCRANASGERLSEEGPAGKLAGGQGARGAGRRWAPLRGRPDGLREEPAAPAQGPGGSGRREAALLSCWRGISAAFVTVPNGQAHPRTVHARPGPAAMPAMGWLHPRGSNRQPRLTGR